MDYREMAQEVEKQDKARTVTQDMVAYGISIHVLPSGERIDPTDFCQSRVQWESRGRRPGR